HIPTGGHTTGAKATVRCERLCTVTDVTTPGEQRARLDARSAELRKRVSELLNQFDERTTRLREAQQAAAALSARLTSSDDLVRVTVDATGMLTDLHIDPSAFARTTPDALARTIGDLVRRGTIQVRGQAAELMRPLTEGLPDLSDLSEGAPSLSDMLPKIPDYPAPEPAAEPIMTNAPRPVSPRDDAPETWLTR
ncbi:MAG TPA: YbaB/EbfC family nucleoid-associated protein, partial [Pseudonocardiaceae bacterium]